MAKRNPPRRQPSNPPSQGGQPQVMPQAEANITIDLADIFRQMSLGNPAQLIRAIEQKRGSRLLCLVFSETPAVPIALNPSILAHFEGVLRQMGKVPKLDVFLRCTGGVTEVPWRLVSLLREFTDELGVFVANHALSGATHIAIAADELIMTPFSVLGSVDPTRTHPLLPKDGEGRSIPTSVQDLKHSIEFIRDQLGENYSSQNLALIISELFKYVDPLAIGALEQSYNLSRLITEKVLKTRNVSLDDTVVKNVIDWLAGKYFSHSFLISRAEVESDLGLPVSKPDAELERMIYALGDYYSTQFRKSIPVGNQATIASVVAFLQTTEQNNVVTIIVQDGNVIFDSWLKTNLGGAI